MRERAIVVILSVCPSGLSLCLSVWLTDYLSVCHALILEITDN